MFELRETTSAESHNNLSYIERHRNIFNIEPSFLVRQFEAFAGQACGWGLECSCKVERNRLHAARFNLFRQEPSLADFQAAMAFFRKVEARIGVTLDDRWLGRFLGNSFNPVNVLRIAVGIDARSDVPRLKFFIFPADWPEARARAVSFCENRSDLRALLAYADFWFVGFDLFLDGQSDFELYLLFDKLSAQEPSVRRLVECLAPAIQPWIVKSRSGGFGFSPGRSGRVVYFNPLDPDSFIAGLGSDEVKHVHARYRRLSPLRITIGFPESRMRDGVTDTVNLYYYLTNMTPGQMRSARPDPNGPASSAERFPVLAVG